MTVPDASGGPDGVRFVFMRVCLGSGCKTFASVSSRTFDARRQCASHNHWSIGMQWTSFQSTHTESPTLHRLFTKLLANRRSEGALRGLAFGGRGRSVLGLGQGFDQFWCQLFHWVCFESGGGSGEVALRIQRQPLVNTSFIITFFVQKGGGMVAPWHPKKV